MYLTEYELQMMHVIWRAKGPVTGMEIVRRSPDKSWKINSLHPMLQRLLKKGFIREAEIIRDGKAFARTFLPVISCEEYYTKFLSDATKDAGISALFSALIYSDDFDDDALCRIQHALEQRKRSMSEDV